MGKKPANVFWDTIREARTLVEKGSQGPKRKRHQQKKMPLKMLQGVRKKMKRKIKKERQMNIEGGVIYNSFHGKERKHFAIGRIRNEKIKEKLLRNDFGKTSKIIQTEKKIMEKRSERKERRKQMRKQKKLDKRNKRDKRGQAIKTEFIKKEKKPFVKKEKINHLNYQDGVLHINPKLFN